MWTKWIAAAAVGACYRSYTPKPCPSDATNRCLPYHTIQHTTPVGNTACPDATANVTAHPAVATHALFSDFVNRQQGELDPVIDEEKQCTALGVDECTCFDSDDLKRLVETSTIDKTELTYGSVAAACGTINTTDAQVIAAARLKKVRPVAIVASAKDVPIGTYAFTCENTGPDSLFVLREDRVLAEVEGDEGEKPFTMGLFRDVALSDIQGCACNGAQITRLVVAPGTLKPTERVDNDGVWFDTSLCEKNMESCLIEEMQRDCSTCAPGQTQGRCGLFYDTICTNEPHAEPGDGTTEKADPTVAYIFAVFVVTGAVLLILSVGATHRQEPQVEKAPLMKPKAQQPQQPRKPKTPPPYGSLSLGF